MSRTKTKENKKDTSPIVPQRSKFKGELSIREFPWTDKQKQIISAILDKNNKIVFIDGCAGTSKTLLAVYGGLKLLNEKRISDIIYVRSPIESASRSMGYVKGDNDEKFAPYIGPLEDKLEELLCSGDINALKGDVRIKGSPVNYLRGASWAAKYIVSDESQNFNFKELTTIITRLGKFSKLIIIGDTAQSDIRDSGFYEMFNLFNDEESREKGIISFKLNKEDIMRSEELKFIIEKIESRNNFGTWSPGQKTN